MAKYYVRCGELRRVVHRDNRERAALDVVLGELVSGDGCLHHISSMMHMGLVTAVCEHGFDSRKASYYPTHVILCRQGPFAASDDADTDADDS